MSSNQPGGGNEPTFFQAVVLKNGTKVGVIGGALYVVSLFARAWAHRSLGEAVDAVGYAGLLIAAAGAAWRSKKAADASVKAAAIVIRADPGTPNISDDPAIQRELDKQNGKGHS